MHRVLYVTGASGPRFKAHMAYTKACAEKHLGVEVMELPVGEGRSSYYARLNLPLMPELRERYDRIVWFDADVEIVSPAFAEFAQLDMGGREVMAVPDVYADIFGPMTRDLAASRLGVSVPPERVYCNTGVLCFDLHAIDPADWKRRWDRVASVVFPCFDQGTLHCMTDAAPAPERFNVYHSRLGEVPDACAVHYTGYEPNKTNSKKVLDFKSGYAEAPTGHLEIDRVFMLCYTGYPERAKRLFPAVKPALEALGVADRVDTVWQFPTPFDQWYCSRVPHEDELSTTRKGCVSAGFGHYRALKTAYELGYYRILVIEDDCRFVEDVRFLRESVASAPADGDLLLLDHTHVREPMAEPVNGWQRCGRSYSAACYIVTRKAMERLIDMHESTVNGRYSKPVLRICDHWQDVRCLGQDVHVYCAVPNLAIQRVCGASNCGSFHLTKAYDRLGLDLGAYTEF